MKQHKDDLFETRQFNMSVAKESAKRKEERFQEEALESEEILKDRLLDLLGSGACIELKDNSDLTFDEVKTLKIQEEFYILRNCLWSSLKNFPKWERNGLTVIMKQNLIDFEANLNLGRFIPSLRKQKYQMAQTNLEAIKSCIELARQQEYISKKFYRYLSTYTSIVGKMMTSLIKTSTARKAAK